MSLDPITAVSDLADTIVKRIWPDASDVQKQNLAIILGQLDVNKTEAGNQSVFVSGWRPFVGWVCASAFAFQFIVQPLFTFIFVVMGKPVQFPVLDSTQMFTVLGGLLGLGTMRTVEKSQKVEDRHG
jgi:hypothetical protein